MHYSNLPLKGDGVKRTCLPFSRPLVYFHMILSWRVDWRLAAYLRHRDVLAPTIAGSNLVDQVCRLPGLELTSSRFCNRLQMQSRPSFLFTGINMLLSGLGVLLLKVTCLDGLPATPTIESLLSWCLQMPPE